MKNAAYWALSIFIICSHSKNLEVNFDYVMATRKQMQAFLQRAQSKNEGKFLFRETKLEEHRKVYRK